jgi:tRNA G37 N-methylase Trm5
MYALDRNKLVPVAIENVTLPFRFKGVQTLSLLGWDGSRDFSEFRRLVDDISAILGPNPSAAEAEESHKVEEERFREKERQRSEETAKRKAEEANRRRIDQEVPNPWRTYGPVVAAVAVVLIIFSFVFWWPKRQATERVEKQQPQKQITTQSLPVIGKVVRRSPQERRTGARDGSNSGRIVSHG